MQTTIQRFSFKASNTLIEVSRWGLLVGAVLIVWIYGGTRSAAIVQLPWWIFGIFFTWVLGTLLGRRKPRTPSTLIFVIGALLAFGWFMTVNARAEYLAYYGGFIPRSYFIGFLPGSIDVNASIKAMTRVSALLALVILACDLARNERWLTRVWSVLATNAIIWALFAMIQKSTKATSVFWEETKVPVSFFGTYGYHGNAATFLLIGLALALGKLFMSARRGAPNQLVIIYWALGALFIFVALFVNTSRAGHILGIGEIVIVSAMMFHRFWRRDLRKKTGVWLVPMVCIICLSGMLFSVDWTHSRERWLGTVQESSGIAQESIANRVKSSAVAWRAVVQNPWFGYGPGTFKIVFPAFFHLEDDMGNFLWKYAHNDYLQTIMDWGIIAASFWGFLIFYAVWRARFRLGTERKKSYCEEVEGLSISLTLAMVATLVHAAFDFPLQILSIQAIFAILIGLAWGFSSPSGLKPRK